MWDDIIKALIGALVILIPIASAWAVKFLKDKIDENTKVTNQVKVLVDGTKGALLSKLADTLESLSRVTKDDEDQKRAETARLEANAHEASMASAQILIERDE